MGWAQKKAGNFPCEAAGEGRAVSFKKIYDVASLIVRAA